MSRPSKVTSKAFKADMRAAHQKTVMKLKCRMRKCQLCTEKAFVIMAVVKAALRKSRLQVLNVTFKIKDHIPVVKALNKKNGQNTGCLLTLVKVANMMTIQLTAVKVTEKSKSEFVSSIKRDRKRQRCLN